MLQNRLDSYARECVPRKNVIKFQAVAGWISEVWTHGFPKNYIFSEEAWRMAGHYSEVAMELIAAQ